MIGFCIEKMAPLIDHIHTVLYTMPFHPLNTYHYCHHFLVFCLVDSLAGVDGDETMERLLFGGGGFRGVRRIGAPSDAVLVVHPREETDGDRHPCQVFGVVVVRVIVEYGMWILG